MGPLSHSRIQIWAQDRLISNLFSVFSFLPHCLHQEDEEEEEKGVKSIHTKWIEYFLNAGAMPSTFTHTN